jgi:hypothetical protein
MSLPAGPLAASPARRVPVTLPEPLLREAKAYCARHDADLSWAVRRALRLLLDEETCQANALGAPAQGRRRRRL